MKKIKFILISIIVLTTFSCSKSDSDSPATSNAPENLYPSDYALRNASGTTQYYVYFGLLNNPFSSNTISSILNQGSYSNKIIYTYNKPNGTILIGPSVNPNQMLPSNSPFQIGSTYNFSINGDKLTITANGQNYILTLEP
jgi:hypothetical protein